MRGRSPYPSAPKHDSSQGIVEDIFGPKTTQTPADRLLVATRRLIERWRAFGRLNGRAGWSTPVQPRGG
jgi:hypothetical protein